MQVNKAQNIRHIKATVSWLLCVQSTQSLCHLVSFCHYGKEDFGENSSIYPDLEPTLEVLGCVSSWNKTRDLSHAKVKVLITIQWSD